MSRTQGLAGGPEHDPDAEERLRSWKACPAVTVYWPSRTMKRPAGLPGRSYGGRSAGRRCQSWRRMTAHRSGFCRSRSLKHGHVHRYGGAQLTGRTHRAGIQGPGWPAGCGDRWPGVPALHVVSAWAAEAQLVPGQRKTNTRSNEITAIPQLLALLELRSCQTAIAEDLRTRGADHVLALKQNQLHLYEAVVEMFAQEQAEAFDGCPHTFTETVGKGRGRIETRRCWALDDPDYRCHVDPDRARPGLRSPVMVEAERCREGRTTTETRYFISSLPAQDKRLPQAVRGHWGIGNSLHWVLDIAFREDESRIRTGHAAHNMALLRRLALNLLRRDRQARGGLAARRKRAGWDHRYLRELLTQ